MTYVREEGKRTIALEAGITVALAEALHLGADRPDAIALSIAVSLRRIADTLALIDGSLSNIFKTLER